MWHSIHPAACSTSCLIADCFCELSLAPEQCKNEIEWILIICITDGKYSHRRKSQFPATGHQHSPSVFISSAYRDTGNLLTMAFRLSPWWGTESDSWRGVISVLDCSVLQGSILSPMLFSICKHHFTQIVRGHRLGCYQYVTRCFICLWMASQTLPQMLWPGHYKLWLDGYNRTPEAKSSEDLSCGGMRLGIRLWPLAWCLWCLCQG